MHACSWNWGSEALGCRTLRLESQSSAGLRMQPYPRVPDLVWPGHLHGTGCLSARAMDTGFSYCCVAFVLGSGLCLGLGSVTLPALAGILGGCVWVRFVVSPLFSPLGFAVFAVWVGFRPAPHLSWVGFWDVRGCVRAPPAPRRSRFWCAVWACVLGSGFRLRPASPWGGVAEVCVRSCVCPACPRPSWGAVRGAGVCGCCRWRGVPPPLPPPFFFFCFVVLVAGCPRRWSRGLCPPSLLFRAALFGVCVFFVFLRGVCPRVLGVPSLGGPLPSAWCCWFWLSCPPAPLWGVLSSVPSGWGVWPPLVVLVGGVVAVGHSRAPPPLLFFFSGGGVCLFLPLPSLGWRTHWSAFCVVFRFAVGGCVLPGRAPPPWVGWVMYTLGSAPLPAGLGSGSAGWAVVPGGFVWPWVSRVPSSLRCRL